MVGFFKDTLTRGTVSGCTLRPAKAGFVITSIPNSSAHMTVNDEAQVLIDLHVQRADPPTYTSSSCLVEPYALPLHSS